MISIIISTYRRKFIEELNENIKQSIGDIQYEIIKIQNSGLMSLGEAYNKGAALAKYDKLLFIHEDIRFLSNQWSFVLDALLEKNNLGIVGVAGNVKKFHLPTGHDQGIEKYRYVYVKHSENEKILGRENNCLHRVKTLDGVFLAMKKEIWTEFKFDEKILGYHFYDLDISLRVGAKFNNYVTSDIPIYHFSHGNFDNAWIESSLKFHKKSYSFDISDSNEIRKVRKFWYVRLLYENIKLKNRFNYIAEMGVDKVSILSAINFLFSRKIF